MCGTIAAVSVFAPNGASSLEDEVRSGRKIAVCWPGLLSPVTAPLTLSLRTVIGGVMFLCFMLGIAIIGAYLVHLRTILAHHHAIAVHFHAVWLGNEWRQ